MKHNDLIVIIVDLNLAMLHSRTDVLIIEVWFREIYLIYQIIKFALLYILIKLLILNYYFTYLLLYLYSFLIIRNLEPTIINVFWSSIDITRYKICICRFIFKLNSFLHYLGNM